MCVHASIYVSPLKLKSLPVPSNLEFNYLDSQPGSSGLIYSYY